MYYTVGTNNSGKMVYKVLWKLHEKDMLSASRKSYILALQAQGVSVI